MFDLTCPPAEHARTTSKLLFLMLTILHKISVSCGGDSRCRSTHWAGINTCGHIRFCSDPKMFTDGRRAQFKKVIYLHSCVSDCSRDPEVTSIVGCFCSITLTADCWLLTADCWLELVGEWILLHERNVTERRQRPRTRTRVSAEFWLQSELHLKENLPDVTQTRCFLMLDFVSLSDSLLKLQWQAPKWNTPLPEETFGLVEHRSSCFIHYIMSYL